MTIGTKIYEYRKKAGMTQEELAERLGVSRQAVSKWESDYAIPETEKILEMCRLFNASADDLLLDGAPPQGEQAAPQKDYGFIKHSGLHFEYISKTKVHGIPLLHVNFGFCHCKAKGIFAFGNVATGIVAFGFLSVGLLSFGLLSIGLLAFGSASIGLFAAGAVAVGALAFGGAAIGIICFGGFSAGYVAVGGAAFGQYAAGGYAKGFLAAGQSGTSGKHAFLMPDEFSMLKEYVNNYLNNPLARLILNVAKNLK